MRLAGFGFRAPKAPNPGRALAGTVTSVGSRRQRLPPRRRGLGTCDGSFAEYARVTVDKLAIKPASSSFEEAAAAPISGVTALQAVRKADVQSGRLSGVVTQKLIMLTSKENAEDLGLLRELVETGQVTPALDRSFSLDHAAEAIRRVRAGEAIGKVIVAP